MSKCNILCESVPLYYSGGYASHSHVNTPCETRARCQTHNWYFYPNNGYTLNVNSLCPIGQIEQAIEDGIARIERAVGGERGAKKTKTKQRTDFLYDCPNN